MSLCTVRSRAENTDRSHTKICTKYIPHKPSRYLVRGSAVNPILSKEGLKKIPNVSTGDAGLEVPSVARL